MSTNGPNYPTTVSQTGGVRSSTGWTNINSIKTVDGLSSTADLSNGGSDAGSLLATGYGFSIPASAVITGIAVTVKKGGAAVTDSGVFLMKANSTVGSDKSGLSWSTGLPVTYGGASDLWGTTWTYSDINGAGFGVSFGARNTSGGGTASVDYIGVTVYWTTAPANVPKRYQYKVYNHGVYAGNLPNVISDYSHSLDINSAGASIVVKCALSVDTAALQAATTIDDESGNPIQDESGLTITSEGSANLVSPAASTALIRNGNRIVVVEESYYNPNGKIMFQGMIERVNAKFGGDGNDGDIIEITAYSDSSDLDNYILTGPPFAYTADQTQTSISASDNIFSFNGSGASGYNHDGQSFTVGTGVTNLAAIGVIVNGAATATMSIYTSSDFATGFLGSATVTFDTGGAAAEVKFALANRITVTPGTTYYFAIRPADSNHTTIYYNSPSTYSGGQYFTSNYAGGSGGTTWFTDGSKDLAFTTYSSNGNTTATFTAADPSTGMLKPIIDDYVRRGGRVNYSSTSVDATGLTLTYTFNTATVLEGLKSVLSLAPNGFYYYVDIGSNTLYFKQASTTADILLHYGKEITALDLTLTIENVKNSVYFTGGIPSGSSTNLYKSYQDTSSINSFGPRLDRKTDNRVTVTGTADAIGNSEIATLEDEKYETTVTVLDKSMDTSTLRPGLIIGFRGFGSFIDTLLLQIVRVDYFPEKAVLTLGILPKRLNPQFEFLTRNLLALATVANPTAPS